jgi:hypothetical protein
MCARLSFINPLDNPQAGTRLSLKRNKASTKTFFSEAGGMDFAPFPLAPSLIEV